MGFAHLIGAAFRAAGSRVRDLDPAHRRDGAGFTFLALAILVAGGVWWQLPKPLGPAIVAIVRGLFGAAAFVVPILLAALAARVLRHPERVNTGGRVVIGWTALSLGVLGLIHIANDTPNPQAGAQAMRHAGGIVGFMVASPLVSGVRTALAIPLLVLLALFGLLVVTATPVNAIPRRLGELRAKLLRRQPEAAHDDELQIDLAARTVTRGARSVDLTAREWALFEVFVQRPGQVMSKAQLEERLYAFGAEVESNTIEVHVSRLRKKIEPDPKNPRYIKTVWGGGYMMAVEPETE